MKKKVKLIDIHMDEKLLFLRKVNPQTVHAYREKYRNGEKFPPIIIQQGTGRVVSGNHRYTAMLKEFGSDYEAEVIEKHYPTERDVLIDFVTENTRHGLPLGQYSKSLIINELMNNEGCSKEDIAKIFNISVRRVEKYGDNMVSVIIGGTGKKPQIESRPAKRGFAPSRALTMDEYLEHHMKDRGIPIGQKVNELVRWLNNDLVHRSDNNMASIERLKASCEKWLEKAEVEA